jgi:hypothetical protein
MTAFSGDNSMSIRRLTTDKKERKETPITTGVIDYFPLAIAAVARVSFVGNQQHNPGQPLHWAREKSTDHADCISRHLIERGTLDDDDIRHSAKLAWRALAMLQEELERAFEEDQAFGDGPGTEAEAEPQPKPTNPTEVPPGSTVEMDDSQ